MKLLKLVGALLVGMFVFMAIKYPKATAILAIMWVAVGITASFAYSGRRSIKNWRTIDTILAIIFGVFGPLSITVLRSKDPRL
jgi:FtsH-binding integral membrane protein